jgi:NAD(P)H-flavin reductase
MALDVEALRRSWAEVARHGDDVPLRFYSTLFVLNPEVRSMFPVYMAGQRDRLVGALGQVVSNAHDAETLAPVLRELGRTHRKFGVVAEHYPLVGEALLQTLEYFLPEWDTHLSQQWQAAFGVVSQLMIEGADEAARHEAAWTDGTITAHDRRTIDIAVIRIGTAQPHPYTAGQSFDVETTLVPGTWRPYSPANRPGGREIEFHVKAEPGGLLSSALVYKAEIGDPVRLAPALGSGLTLDERENSRLLLLAGGTGLAPFRALIDELSVTPGPPPMTTLIVGARAQHQLYDNPTLTALHRQLPWLTVITVVSDDPAVKEEERATPVEAALSRGVWDGHDIYVCGPPRMVRDSFDRLVEAGIEPKRIKFERYTHNRYITEGGAR